MDRLEELLLEWEDRRHRGIPTVAEALCPDDTALRQRLVQEIRFLEAYDALMRPWPSLAPEVPERIGKYEIRGVVGTGGMGVVYDAWDPILARRVAIKIIHPCLLAGGHNRAAARFEQEGQALAKLGRANIVAVFEAGIHNESPYLVMEYVGGGSLAVHRERLTAAGPVAVARLVEKVARAVQFAHDRGVLHKDLKPANILLGPADEPLVADFGLAKLYEPEPGLLAPLDAETLHDSRPIALTDTVQPGTPPYMAPEQHDPALGEIGPATDVWALGVILYELVSGTRPFAETDYLKLARQVRQPPNYTRFRGRAERRLATVISHCLQVAPDRRYRSAREVADALARSSGLTRRGAIRWAIGSSAVLAASVPIGLALSDPYRQFCWRTAPLARRLARGESIDVIRPGGGSPDSFVHVGEGSTQVGIQDGCWVVRSTALALIELVHQLPEAPCRVQIELRHDHSVFQADPNGGSGLVFGISRIAASSGWLHLVSRVAFDDWGRKGWLSIGSLWPVGSQNQEGPIVPPIQTSPANSDSIYPAPSSRPSPFRAIELTITPTEVSGRWEGPPVLPIAAYTRERIDEHIERVRTRYPEPEPGQLRERYAYRIGLIVSGGQISVRSLRISSQSSSL